MPEDPSPLTTRAAQQNITEPEIFRIQAALEKTGGHKANAAKMLGIEPQRLYNVVKNTPSLASQWMNRGDCKVPTEGDLVNRLSPEGEPALSPIAASSYRVVKALEKQDELLTKGWEKLGYNEKEVDFLANLQKEYAANTRKTTDLTYAGAAHTATRLMLEFQKVLDSIRDIDEHPENYHRTAFSKDGGEYEVKGPHEFRLELYNVLIKIADTLRKTNGDLTEANKVRLAIMKMERELAQKDGPKTVAGWETPRK